MTCRFRKFDIVEPSPSIFLTETSIFTPKTLTPSFFPHSFPHENELDFTLDLLNPSPPTLTLLDFSSSPLEEFDTITDLVQIDKTPFYTTSRRVIQQRGAEKATATPFYLQSLCDRVSVLELGFDRLADRKYTWTAEINSPKKDGVDRKYKWTTEIKRGSATKKAEKNYKWTTEINGKGENSPISRKYTWTASAAGSDRSTTTKKKSEKSAAGPVRVVEIRDSNNDQGTVVLRQAFAKRGAVVGGKNKGKKKALTPQDAALMIQITFRAYLIRRSQSLRAFRELAIAKGKLKEIRALFNNFSYRRRLARDAVERQKYSERIIVLLLTVDAIEGADLMVRAAKRSMVDELEAMLDVVDPQPQGRSHSVKRRTFDMPDGVIQKELAAGVEQVVRMLDQEHGSLKL